MTEKKDDPVRDQLIDELSSVLAKILKHGGPGALAASAAGAVMVAATAVPAPLFVEFIAALLEAVSEGAKVAGHGLSVVGIAEIVRPEDEPPKGSVH